MKQIKISLLTLSLLIILLSYSYAKNEKGLDGISKEIKTSSAAIDKETQNLSKAEADLISANDEILTIEKQGKKLRWYHFFRKKKLNQKRIEAEKRLTLAKNNKKESLQNIDDLDKKIEDIKTEIDKRKEESKTLKGHKRAEANKNIAELHKEIADLHQKMARIRAAHLERNKVKKVIKEKKVKIKKGRRSEKEITIEKTKKTIVKPEAKKKAKNKKGGSTNY